MTAVPGCTRGMSYDVPVDCDLVHRVVVLSPGARALATNSAQSPESVAYKGSFIVKMIVIPVTVSLIISPEGGVTG